MFKKMTLKQRIMISICTVVFAAFAGTIAFVTHEMRAAARKNAEKIGEEMAFRYGAMVQARLEVAMDTARTLAHVMEGMRKNTAPDRAVLDDMLAQALIRNPEFIGVWSCWEPDALDGRDAAFAGKPGHDETGRYIPYWNRGNGRIVLEPLMGYDVPGAGDYYLLAKDGGRETIIDPYKYPIGGKEVLITSLSAPIIVGGKVLGVAGVDIALDAFQDLIAEIKPFETGYGYLVSHNAVLVAHPNKEIVGLDFIPRQAEADRKPISEAIETGKMHKLYKLSKATGINSFQVLTPITIGKTDTPWSFIISIPTDRVMAGADRLMWFAIGIGGVAMAILLLVLFVIARGIALPIGRISSGLNSGADQVSSAAREVSSASQQLAEGTSEQAASLEETASSLEQMATMTRQNAENAGETNALVKRVDEAVKEAGESMMALTDAIQEISRASEETSKIIKTIDEIAFQTNLLALNAAVEAARAGAAGAGFAVVADEVRNLAIRAAAAAKDTASLIEGTVGKTRDGAALVIKSNDAFQLVAENTRKASELTGEIAGASQEQAQGIEQIGLAMGKMDQVVQQNAANAEESASAAEQMSAEAVRMKAMVGELVALVNGQSEKESRPVTSLEMAPLEKRRLIEG